jgi:hypothetical protein
MLDKFAKARSGKQSTFKEMFDNLPPVKLAAKPYLKEKVLVLDRDSTALEQSTSVVNLTGSYMTESNRHALLANDVGSIVRVDCKKGKKVGNYTTPEGEVIPAYEATCEVLIIDNTLPAVIATKTFKNEDMADFKFVGADKGGKVSLKEVVIPKPVSEIKDFLNALATN